MPESVILLIGGISLLLCSNFVALCAGIEMQKKQCEKDIEYSARQAEPLFINHKAYYVGTKYKQTGGIQAHGPPQEIERWIKIEH